MVLIQFFLLKMEGTVEMGLMVVVVVLLKIILIMDKVGRGK